MSRIAAMGIPISSTNMPARERHTRQLAFNNSAVLIPERFDSSINDDSGFRDTRSGVLLQATLCENVAQKSGLNKSILDQSWFETRRQLEYKQFWLGGEVIAVPPQHTSQRCPDCQHVSAENRKTQSKFVCQSCGFASNADFVGALNILAAGHAVLACRDTSCAVSTSAQEPTEGIVCASL